MGHYCKICGCSKSNESFSGGGHKNHICKKCSRKPKEVIQDSLASDEIFNFLHQSHVSKKNISRLKVLVNSESKDVGHWASIVLQVALICPYKKRRLKNLAQKDKELLNKLNETGLVFAHHY